MLWQGGKEPIGFELDLLRWHMPVLSTWLYWFGSNCAKRDFKHFFIGLFVIIFLLVVLI